MLCRKELRLQCGWRSGAFGYRRYGFIAHAAILVPSPRVCTVATKLTRVVPGQLGGNSLLRLRRHQLDGNRGNHPRNRASKQHDLIAKNHPVKHAVDGLGFRPRCLDTHRVSTETRGPLLTDHALPTDASRCGRELECRKADRENEPDDHENGNQTGVSFSVEAPIPITVRKNK